MRKRAVTIDLQPWAYPERPRVLIEHPEPDTALELAAAIRRAGVVAATVGETLELRDLLEGCTVAPVSAKPEQVVAAVLDALPGDSRNPTAGPSN